MKRVSLTMLKKGDRFKAWCAVKQIETSFNVVGVISDCRIDSDYGTIIGRTSDGIYKSFPIHHYGYDFMVDVIHEAPREKVAAGGPAPMGMKEALSLGTSRSKVDKPEKKFCTLVVCQDCGKRMPGGKDPSRIDYRMTMRKNRTVPVCPECKDTE